MPTGCKPTGCRQHGQHGDLLCYIKYIGLSLPFICSVDLSMCLSIFASVYLSVISMNVTVYDCDRIECASSASVFCNVCFSTFASTPLQSGNTCFSTFAFIHRSIKCFMIIYIAIYHPSIYLSFFFLYLFLVAICLSVRRLILGDFL